MDVKQQRIQDLVMHAISTLPDSLSERRRVLEGCLAALGSSYSELHSRIARMICLLDEHNRAQRELPLLFAGVKEAGR